MVEYSYLYNFDLNTTYSDERRAIVLASLNSNNRCVTVLITNESYLSHAKRVLKFKLNITLTIILISIELNKIIITRIYSLIYNYYTLVQLVLKS